MTNPSREIQHHQPRTIKRYKYLHIWSSEEEVRVKCTDQLTIERVIRAIETTYSDLEIENHEDLTEQVHFIKIKGFNPRERHHQIGWWMFKVLLDEGWEPIDTGEHWYKLKYLETQESPFI